MNWLPGFSNPMGAWLFAAMIPVIVFYFLKLRRTRLELSSLALWRQVISDQRVNAPFQKFKRNLLLLLQLLLVALLALALTQPFMMGANSQEQQIIVMVDCSASMAAVDAAGKSRLDLAKEEIGRLVDGLLPGQQMCLFEITNAGRNLAFTDNKTVLRRELDQLRVTDVPSRLETGLNLVQGLTLGNERRTVMFFTDGNLPTRPDPISGQAVAAVDLQLPFQVNLNLVPKAGDNLGLTSLNARPAGRDKWELFTRVEGSSPTGGQAKIQLLINGQPDVEDQFILTGADSQKLVFKVSAREKADVEVRLIPESGDSIASDNVARIELPALRDLSVYCPPTLPAWRHALSGMEGIVVDPPENGTSRSAVHDLVITDTLTDLARGSRMSVIVGQIPSDLVNQLKTVEGEAEVVDWQRNGELLQHVRLKDVRISGVPTRAEGVTDSDIESLGYRILAFGSGGPLILEKRAGALLQEFVLFHTDRSTLPYRLGFPIFVNNCVNLALRQSELSEVQAMPTGAVPPMTLKPETTYTVTGPDGRHQDLFTDKSGMLHAFAAPQVGQYTVRTAGNVVRTVGASLLNSTETTLTQVDRIVFNDSSAEATTQTVPESKSFWPWLAGLAFAVLLVEWWFYQKRPVGAPA